MRHSTIEILFTIGFISAILFVVGLFKIVAIREEKQIFKKEREKQKELQQRITNALAKKALPNKQKE